MKTTSGTIMIALIILGIGLVGAHEGNNNLGHHGMMSSFYGGFGMGFFGWIFMSLVIVALVLLIIWLIKQIQEKPRSRKR